MNICLWLGYMSSKLRQMHTHTDFLNSADHSRVRRAVCYCCWDRYRLTGNADGSGDPSTAMYMLWRRNPTTLYTIHGIQHAIGDKTTHLMFIHAMTGCDTVSAIYRQGQHKAFNMIHCWTHSQRRMARWKVQVKMGPATLNHLMNTATHHESRQLIEVP